MSFQLNSEYERIGRLREEGLINLNELSEMRAWAWKLEQRRQQRAKARDQLRRDLENSK